MSCAGANAGLDDGDRDGVEQVTDLPVRSGTGIKRTEHVPDRRETFDAQRRIPRRRAWPVSSALCRTREQPADRDDDGGAPVRARKGDDLVAMRPGDVDRTIAALGEQRWCPLP